VGFGRHYLIADSDFQYFRFFAGRLQADRLFDFICATLDVEFWTVTEDNVRDITFRKVDHHLQSAHLLP